MVCRSHFGGIAFTAEPAKRFDITGFVIPNNASRQIAPRTINDIVEVLCTVTFKNWDNSIITTNNYSYGASVVIPANPTRPSNNTWYFTFKAWNPTVVSPIVADATYIATYDSAKIVYTVTVVASPTTGGIVSGGGNFNYGDNTTITATANTGYTFTGWNDGNATSPRVVTVTGNATYTATFTPNTYTLTLLPNGGTVTPASITVTYDALLSSAQPPLPTPERPGYTFTGWYIGTTLITATTIWNYTSNQTAQASWSVNTYKLTLDPSTGTCGTPFIQITYGQNILSIPNATQPGCTFLGWFLKGGNTQVSAGTQWIWDKDTTAVARFNYPIVSTNNHPALGTITPLGNTNYTLGQTATYTCTPNSNAYISSIIVDGVPVWSGVSGTSEEHIYTFNNIGAAHTIAVNFAVNCYPMNPANVIPSGVSVSMTPSGCVPHGAPVTFNISSNCYNITSIKIGGVTQTSLTYTIPSVEGPLPKIEIEAVIKTYPIVASGSNNMGSITPSGTTQVDCGTNQTYNFITNIGYRVSVLKIDGSSVPVPETNSYTFYNVTAPHTIYVEFEESPYYVIQFGPDASQNAGGVVYPTLNPTAQYFILVDSAKSCAFSIVPSTGFTIDKVYVDNVPDNPAALTGIYTFTHLNANHTIYATFKPIKFTIHASANAGGSINPNGAVQVDYGANQTFYAAPNYGYHLVEVLVNGVNNPAAVANGYYTFEEVKSNHTISAVFALNTYIITATAADAHGSITPSGDIEVNHGVNKTFTFAPHIGYKIATVLVDGDLNPTAVLNGSYTFTNLNDNHTIVVAFTKQIFTITSSCTAGGYVEPNEVPGAGYVEEVEYDQHSAIYAFFSDPGYILKYVIIDGTIDYLAVQNGMYRFLNVKKDHTIHVVFAPANFTITASSTFGGVINPAGLITVPNGADKTFYFSPTAGFELVRVIIDGINHQEAVDAGEYTFNSVDGNHIISAQFEKSDYNVYLPEVEGAVVVAVNGSSSPVAYGAKFEFTVAMLEGYTQSQGKVEVRANGVLILPLGITYTINNITEDQTVIVDGIVRNQYQIVAKTGNFGGAITPAGTTTVPHGTDLPFVITPNANYKVDYLLVNGVKETGVESYTLYNIKANGTITAYFIYNPVEINEPHEPVITVFSHSNVVTIENLVLIPVKHVEIMDMYGRLVWSGSTTGERTEITLNVAKGIYAVRITTEDNILSTTKVSIK
jgi:uncharacterized repeat protein (TIGR02543 family)